MSIIAVNAEWSDATKTVVDIAKSIAPMVPEGASRVAYEHKLAAIEEIMKRSDAKLAHDLGYKMCQCTFPPQIALWKESKKAHVCPNPACGQEFRHVVSPKAIRELSRGGPNGWTG